MFILAYVHGSVILVVFGHVYLEFFNRKKKVRSIRNPYDVHHPSSEASIWSVPLFIDIRLQVQYDGLVLGQLLPSPHRIITSDALTRVVRMSVLGLNEPDFVPK